MAWETRRNGRCYYYRSKRVEGRVVKEYLGCAAWVESAVWLDGRDRETEKNERCARSAERDRVDALDAAVAALYQETEAALVAVLTAAGYHRHDRGAWRKQRGTKTISSGGDETDGDTTGRADGSSHAGAAGPATA